MKSNRLAQITAALAILAALALDLLVKHLFLAHAATWNGATLIPGLLDARYAWNHGVSFSLFWQSSSFGGGVLAALLLAVIVALAIAAFRTARPLAAAGYGVIAGGALGNIADRLQHGAVFDFLALHLGGRPLFICNSADIFISLGVVLLAFDTWRAERKPQPAS
jgi:signal peptidase II